MVLQAIKYEKGTLFILDQLQLPYTEHFIQIHNCQDAWDAIKKMQVRGAPAIAIVAALALAVEISGLQKQDQLSTSASSVAGLLQEKLEYLVSSRPTAVNLADAAGKLGSLVSKQAEEPNTSGSDVAVLYIEAAERMLVSDVQDNEGIGNYGCDWILRNTPAGKAGGNVGILTHCNTG